jgi:hypothetical protein
VGRRHLAVPDAVDRAIQQGTWRDPGTAALREILAGVAELPDMILFTTVKLMGRVSRLLTLGGYVDDPEFCMVRQKADLSSASDGRLVFSRALFVAGSKVPGDDVFVAVDDATTEAGRIVVFDWSRAVPSRWVPMMTVQEFCDVLAREQKQFVVVCPQCQARILHTNPVNRDRGFAIYTCLACGYEQGVEELPALPTSDGPLPPNLVVSVRWKQGAPSVAEIMSLRQLVPRYANVSIAELRDTLARPELPLDPLIPSYADELIARGEALGLELVAREVAGDG